MTKWSVFTSIYAGSRALKIDVLLWYVPSIDFV